MCRRGKNEMGTKITDDAKANLKKKQKTSRLLREGYFEGVRATGRSENKNHQILKYKQVCTNENRIY